MDQDKSLFHSMDTLNVGSGSTALQADKLQPNRGLILARNQKDVPYAPEAIRKWIRLNKYIFKVEKLDFLISEADLSVWDDLKDFIQSESLAVSPRIGPTLSMEGLNHLLESEILDLYLQGDPECPEALTPLIEKANAAQIGVRVLLCGAFHRVTATETLVEALADADVVHLAAHDPFMQDAACPSNAAESRQAIQTLNDLTAEFAAAGCDVSLMGLPFCHVEEANRPYALNRTQFFLDHQQYIIESYTFAERIQRFKSSRLHMAAESKLSRRTSTLSGIDGALFPWILDYPRIYVRTWMFHKLTRFLRQLWRRNRPLPEGRPNYENELDNMTREKQKHAEPACKDCAYQRFCDHRTQAFQRSYPGIAVSTITGDVIATAPVQATQRHRYFDVHDRKRLELDAHLVEFAQDTQDLLLHQTPTREISCDDYDIEGRYTHHMPGAIRWVSLGTGELESTVLGHVEPPFTLSYTLGGGIASHAGFSFGRHIKIVCPLFDYSHRITLSVNEDGYYVLLRDGMITRPTEFENAKLLPPRLPEVLEPRLSIFNIDGMIFSQTVLLWEGERKKIERADNAKYSIVVISTRFTRRLQATLLSILKQEGIAPDKLEIIVGYVPGIDATDDLVDSLEFAYPKARILRSPFPETFLKSKGFMINETIRMTSGDWVVLLDADILLPPDTFARIEAIEQDCHMIAPEGRKMLPPDVTGKILVNEINPQAECEALLNGPGEVRKGEAEGIPIGFFQCVRRDILDKTRYFELDHFEFSDWMFGKNVVDNHGVEHRLKDFLVLHLDHGGSQWYGTHKHR